MAAFKSEILLRTLYGCGKHRLLALHFRAAQNRPVFQIDGTEVVEEIWCPGVVCVAPEDAAEADGEGAGDASSPSLVVDVLGPDSVQFEALTENLEAFPGEAGNLATLRHAVKHGIVSSAASASQ